MADEDTKDPKMETLEEKLPDVVDLGEHRKKKDEVFCETEHNAGRMLKLAQFEFDGKSIGIAQDPAHPVILMIPAMGPLCGLCMDADTAVQLGVALIQLAGACAPVPKEDEGPKVS